MKRVLVFFIVLVAGLSLLLYFKLREQRLQATRPSGGSATIEGTEVDVVARLSARITAIHAREGDVVHQGDVLVELDCTEQQTLLDQAKAGFEGAQLSLSGARVAVALAEQQVSTAQRQRLAAEAGVRASEAQREALLVQSEAAKRAARRIELVQTSGVASEQMLDASRSEATGLAQQAAAMAASTQAAQQQSAAAAGAERAAALQVQAARVKLQATEVESKIAQAALARAAALAEECKLRAPRDGTVQTRSFEVGELALPGSRLLTLVDVREVKATFYLPNAELAAASPGREVAVVADAMPGRTFTGAIRRVGVTAEFTPRNIQTREDRDRLVYAVEVAIPNPEGLLRPGMPVEIVIPGTGRS